MRKQLKNFEDLISIIPNAFDDKICDNLISYHTWAESNKLTTAGEISSLHKPDPNDKRKEIHEPKKSIDCRYEVHGDLNNVHFLNEKLIMLRQFHITIMLNLCTIINLNLSHLFSSS